MTIYEAKKLEVFGKRCYVQITAELGICATCERPMLPIRRGTFDHGLSPAWNQMTIEKQAERAGWAKDSGFRSVDNAAICDACAAKGHAKFKCALCGEERPKGQEHESFGDPPEFLCKPCYETRTAKEYEAKRDALERAHQWDFE